MEILTDTKANPPRSIKAIKIRDVGTRVVTMITDVKIMEGPPMAPSTMTTPTKQSTTMTKIKMMTQRTMVTAIPISTGQTTRRETGVQRTTLLKGTELEKRTTSESIQKEDEVMMEEIEVASLLEAGAEEINEAVVAAMIAISEVEEGATMEVMLTTTIEMTK